VDYDRESPSYVLMSKLEARGARVDYNDPYIPVIRPTREHPQFAGRKSQPITPNYDAILLATAHAEYRTFDFSAFESPLIDTRNAVANRPASYYRA
jgi:UDP-N-acetyl-D-glucosamine dehydrogenase